MTNLKTESKVLVAIPYHEKKRYCLDELFDTVQSLTYKNKEVLMRWDLEEYGGENNVKKQREYFRRHFLDKNFTHLFFLGADTLPPPNVLERLLAHEKPVVGGVYYGRHGAQNGDIATAVAWRHDTKPKKLGKQLAEETELMEVDGMGMDCVLFERRAIELVGWNGWEVNDDDYPMYDKLSQLGFTIYVDPLVHCRHYFNERGYTYKGEVHVDA